MRTAQHLNNLFMRRCFAQTPFVSAQGYSQAQVSFKTKPSVVGVHTDFTDTQHLRFILYTLKQDEM